MHCECHVAELHACEGGSGGGREGGSGSLKYVTRPSWRARVAAAFCQGVSACIERRKAH